MPREMEYPEEGEFVVCTVRTIKGFGAFLLLDEYVGKEGFIHITEIAPGWIKHIKDHIREGQKVVCKVLRVDPKKGHIDLSLKHVNDHQRREKIQAWKAEEKADRLMEIVAERRDMKPEEAMDKFGFELIREFESLYGAFEAVVVDPDVLKELGFKGKWTKDFIEVAEENISPPYVEINGLLEMKSHSPRGVEDVKDALKAAEDISVPRGVKVSVLYLGAPKYRISVMAPDYKTAENVLKEASDTAIEEISDEFGEGTFYRDEE